MEKIPTGRPSVWGEYINRTEGRPPRQGLVEALTLTDGRDAAADLGAGALNDTHYLLRENFSHVLVVDTEPLVAEKVAKIGDSRLEVQITPMQDATLSKDTYDVINAQASLFFVPTQDLPSLIFRIYNALKQGGVLTAQFLGPNDSWRGLPGRYTQSESEIRELLSSFKSVRIEHEDERKGTALNPESIKQWHIMDVLAQKAQ